MRYSRLCVFALAVMGLAWTQADAAPYRPHGRAHSRDRHEEYRPAPSLADQARYFGSEDYYQAHGGNSRDYVIGLYGDVLGRSPCGAEIDRWVSRLSSCGDGVTMAREFLISAQSELSARCCP